jgi:hypothetical protein
MSYASYDYAKYDGDERSSWERLAWIDRRPSYELGINKHDDQPQQIVVEAEILSIEVRITRAVKEEDITYREPAEADSIDLDWKNWDIFDCISVCGIVLMIVGFVTAIFPALRAGGALLPIGLGLMTFAAYGARRRDTYSTT